MDNKIKSLKHLFPIVKEINVQPPPSEYYEVPHVGELYISSEHAVESPPPPLLDSVVSSVIQKFTERALFGQQKYGKTLDRDDLSYLQWVEHAQEELMDAILYLEKLKRETIKRETIKRET